MTDSLHQLIDRLRQSGGLSESGRLADGELLERFVRSCDEAAFEVLVWRHGGTAGWCWPQPIALGNDADAGNLASIRSRRTNALSANYDFG